MKKEAAWLVSYHVTTRRLNLEELDLLHLFTQLHERKDKQTNKQTN